MIEVARRHDLRPNLLSSWRRLAKDGKLPMADLVGAEFAPVVIELPALEPQHAATPPIEIVSSDIVFLLDETTLAAWVGRAAFELKPVYDALLANPDFRGDDLCTNKTTLTELIEDTAGPYDQLPLRLRRQLGPLDQDRQNQRARPECPRGLMMAHKWRTNSIYEWP